MNNHHFPEQCHDVWFETEDGGTKLRIVMAKPCKLKEFRSVISLGGNEVIFVFAWVGTFKGNDVFEAQDIHYDASPASEEVEGYYRLVGPMKNGISS